MFVSSLRSSQLQRFLADKRQALSGDYKTKRMPEVRELASAKLKGGTLPEPQALKVTDRLKACEDHVSRLAAQISQVQGWLDHNPDCYDNAVYGEKRRWIGKNVEAGERSELTPDDYSAVRRSPANEGAPISRRSFLRR